MDDVIKNVYSVFGDNLPSSRSAYSAMTKKPFPILTITKAFKSWTNFEKEYAKYAILQRNAKATKSVVKKKVEPKKYGTK